MLLSRGVFRGGYVGSPPSWIPPKNKKIFKFFLLGHMHLKGCYDWFRKPPTEYEKWEKQHAKKKRRREEEESKRQKREEVWMKECREEMEKRRQFIRDQGLMFFLIIPKYQGCKV